jgi:hypothetical protein
LQQEEEEMRTKRRTLRPLSLIVPLRPLFFSFFLPGRGTCGVVCGCTRREGGKGEKGERGRKRERRGANSNLFFLIAIFSTISLLSSPLPLFLSRLVMALSAFDIALSLSLFIQSHEGKKKVDAKRREKRVEKTAFKLMMVTQEECVCVCGTKTEEEREMERDGKR